STSRSPLISTPVPYTTLFRSRRFRRLRGKPDHGAGGRRGEARRSRREDCQPLGQAASLLQLRRLCKAEAADDRRKGGARDLPAEDRKSTRLSSSHGSISYAVF